MVLQSRENWEPTLIDQGGGLDGGESTSSVSVKISVEDMMGIGVLVSVASGRQLVGGDPTCVDGLVGGCLVKGRGGRDDGPFASG